MCRKIRSLFSLSIFEAGVLLAVSSCPGYPEIHCKHFFGVIDAI